MSTQNSKTTCNYNLERNVFSDYSIKEVDFLMLKIIPMNSLELCDNYGNPSLKDIYILYRGGKNHRYSYGAFT